MSTEYNGMLKPGTPWLPREWIAKDKIRTTKIEAQTSDTDVYNTYICTCMQSTSEHTYTHTHTQVTVGDTIISHVSINELEKHYENETQFVLPCARQGCPSYCSALLW